jgi:hypothetical protein
MGNQDLVSPLTRPIAHHHSLARIETCFDPRTGAFIVEMREMQQSFGDRAEPSAQRVPLWLEP